MAKYPNVYAILDKAQAEVKERAKKALREGANLIAEEARNRVPVKTGELKKSITVVDKYETVLFITANAKRKTKKGKSVAYGRIVEYSPTINKPFLYPAKETKADEVRRKISDAIGEALKNV